MKCNSSLFFLEERNTIQLGLRTVRFVGEDHRTMFVSGESIVFFEYRAFWVCTSLATGPFGFCTSAGRMNKWMGECILGIFASSSFGG